MIVANLLGLMQTNANEVVVRGNESSHVVRCYYTPDIIGDTLLENNCKTIFHLTVPLAEDMESNSLATVEL